MMQYDTNTDVIPPATKGVLELANMISPVTPEGAPTVAGQLMQKAGMMPPQMPQQSPPGMPQVGRMAGIGAQVGATQQQQEQQKMMDMLKQLSQRNQSMNFGVMAAPGAQQFKPPGMAGGGIVGFAGDDGSEVSSEEKEKRQRDADRRAFLLGLESLLAAGKDIATLPGRAVLGAAETAVTRPLRAAGIDIPYLPDAVYGGNRESITPYFDKLRKPEAAPSGIEAAYADSSRGQDVPPEAAPSSPKAAQEQGAARPAATRPAGIATLMGPPAPSSLQRREAEFNSLIQGAEGPTVKTVEQLTAEDAAFRKSQGLPSDPDAAARQRLDALRAEAEAEQKRRMTTPEGEMWNKLIAGLAGAAGTSNFGYTGAGIARGTARAAEAIEDEKQRNFKLFREFKVAEAKELDLMEKAREQRLYGRKADAEKTEAEARDFRNKKRELQAKATMDFGKMFQQEAEMLSREKIANAELAARREERELSREGLSLNKLQSAYSVAQQRVVDATKKAQDILKERHPMAMLFEMNPEAKTKNPDAYANYITDRLKLERDLIKPAVAQREAIAAQLGFAQPATNAPTPGTVMDGYRFNGGNPADKANWTKV